MNFTMRLLLDSMRRDVHNSNTSKAMVYWNYGRVLGYSYSDHDDIGNTAARNEAGFLVAYWQRHSEGTK